MCREDVEKYITRGLKTIRGVEKFYIEKNDKNSVDVIVVSSKLNGASSSKILDLETRVNKKLKTPSNFKIYPIESW